MDIPLQTPNATVNKSEPISTPSDKSVIKQANEVLIAENPLELIKKADIDLVKLLKNLNRIAISAKLVAKDRDGDPVELGEDNKAQITATVAIFELAKLIKDKTTAVNIGIVNNPGVMEKAEEIIEARKRWKSI